MVVVAVPAFLCVTVWLWWLAFCCCDSRTPRTGMDCVIYCFEKSISCDVFTCFRLQARHNIAHFSLFVCLLVYVGAYNCGAWTFKAFLFDCISKAHKILSWRLLVLTTSNTCSWPFFNVNKLSVWSNWSRLLIYYYWFAGCGSPAWKRLDKRDLGNLLLLSVKGWT